MSLINKMLQDLDARRSDGVGAGPFGQQVRAVPEHRRIHPAWWIALALGLTLSVLLAWLFLRPPVPSGSAMAELPLKFDSDLNLQQAIAVQEPVVPENAMQENSISPSPHPVDKTDRAAAPAGNASPLVALAPPPVAAAAVEPQTVKAAPPVRVTKEPLVAPVPELSKMVPATGSLAVPSAAKTREASAPLVNKQVREMTLQQRAENEYRKAVLLLQQGKAAEAISGLELAVQLDTHHASARQALIGIFLEQDRRDEAQRHAREGIQLDPSQAGLAMILARLQLEKGELGSAIETLERSLSYASDRPDYQAFLAALLQRDGKHKQAAQHYLQALQHAPQNGVWWMGLGISLQADRRTPEAQEAFKRAKATNTLSPELSAFVEGRLVQLQR